MRTYATLLIVLCTLLAGVAPAGAVSAPGAATAADAGAADHTLQPDVPECSYPFTATDATGENVTVEEAPETVTTLGASASQTMWDIGGKEQVVGLGTHSYYLADAESRTNVSAAGFGYSTEAVVGTEADLVLASNIVSDDTVAALRDAGMTVYKFRPATSVEDVANKTTLIGKLTGNCVGAAEANAWMNANVETAGNVTADVEQPEVLVPLGGSSLAGDGTFINAMVTTAGGTNLAADAFDSPYPYGVSDETILELDPEMLVLQEGSESLINQQPYAATTAGQNNASVVVNPNWLSQPAPRSVVFATRNLTDGFHPDAAANTEWTARSEVTVDVETATPTEAVTETPTPESTATPESTETTETTSTDSPGFGGPAAVAALGAGAALLARRD
ncbi:PGF-CTERM-anchored ABC transporter substrate-binding protein [Halolamina salifodinae]|uniref:Iron complex transport system substrate-binding protein n=1 Tax=Halolamina salifodinae TaxID=1202767 RepID=A0A8T4GX70_9EURY|nr:PGF-CTERM-anchored ABC transporter substrate-binding protein [Halolamina salifodinae]MBP1987060.1 iron complex transport system substrate-binding protein [Halolamina salifodinae]